MWTLIGIVIVLVVFVVIFGAISELAIPVLLGAVVAVVLKPAADALTRRGVGASAAAAIVLAGLLVIVIAAGAAMVTG